MKKKPLFLLIMRISMFQLSLILSLAGNVLANDGKAQGLLDKKITLKESNIKFDNLLDSIEKLGNFSFVYKTELVNSNKKLAIDVDKLSLSKVLDQVLAPFNLQYEVSNNYIVIKTAENPRDGISNIIITGAVTDSKGETLPGVSVKIKGTQTASQTDANGNYSIKVPDGQSVLVFTYIGFIQQEIKVGIQTKINVTLKDDQQSLEEVVVVGYGTVKKSDITGSVGSVSAKDLTAYPVTDAVMGLQGKTAGVQVIQNSGAPGANVSVRVRGGNSLQGDNEPLYIVDGFALTGTPNSISPNDIENLEVLKDASATAIYGSRGANGVVLITTKRGKSGKAQIDFNSYYAVQQVGKTIDLMNAQQFAEIANERAVNDGVPSYFTQDQINSFGIGTNWQDVIFKKAPMQNYSLTASGGSENTQYSFSGSFLGQEGIIVGSNIKRETLRANINQSLNSKIKLNYTAILSNSNNSQLNSDNGQKGNSVLGAVLGGSPTVIPQNADGTYNSVTPFTFSPNQMDNPLALALERKQAVNQKSILAGTALTYEPLKSLIFKTSVGVEVNSTRSDTYSPSLITVTPKGQASIFSSDRMNILNENTLTYSAKLNEVHDFTLLGGVTYQENTRKFFNTGNVTGFTTDLLETNNLQSGSVPGSPTSGSEKWALFSYLGRINYSYKGTYLLTGSIRSDGSSRFGDGNKWGYFPSAAFAWRIINENFAKKFDFLSDLKFRLSYGITGSTALLPYQTLNTLNPYPTVFNDQLYNGYGPSLTSLANPNLKWETTAQSDAGLDIGFFQNRLLFTFDYYNKNTRDLLENVPIPTSSGYTNTIRNIGKISNSGIEMALNATILDKKAFKWDMNVNFSKNKSKVLELADGNDVFGELLPQPLSVAVNLIRVGEPVGVFYGYLENGLNSKGEIIYQDLNGDGIINLNDKTIIGDPNADFLYNISSSMSFKNFQLDYSFQGKQGGDLFNVNLSSQGSSFYFGENQLREVYENHWSASNPNPDAKYPKISANAKFRESDRYVEDGSFLRCKNIQLAYKVPIEKTALKWIKGLQVYASGQNLFTATKYSWYDPEVNTRGGSNSVSLGIDNTGYPNPKTYTFGFRMSL